MAKIEILTKENSLWDIRVDGIEKTALATGVPNRVFQGTDMSRLRSLPGYLWHADRGIEPWPIEGMAEEENQIIFWGGKLSLKPVETSVPFSAAELSGLTDLFLLFREKNADPAFSTDGFFRTADGGIFCFPLNLMEFIHSRQSKELLMSREIYNHPGLKGEERLSHTLAVLSFQSLTGELPFTRTGGYEWIHEEMRNKKIPSLVQNGIPESDLTRYIDRALSGKSYASLEEWASLWDTAPSLSGAMTDAFREQMTKYEESFVKSFHRRKNQLKIIVGIILAAVVIGAGISGVRSYLAPPYTFEMTPREVVDSYYDAINDLDSMGIDGTTEKKAGKAISNQVATMFVLSKNREAYSQGDTISPVEWKEQGYPDLPSGYSVYGVGDLAIQDLGDNRFRADYLAWYPPTGDPENPGYYEDPFEIYRKTEILTLIRDKRDRSWIIGAIEEISNEPVPSSEVLPKK